MEEHELKKYFEPTLYRVLCLDNSASPTLIKKTFWEMSKIEHPDVSKEPAHVANEKFQKIKFAYDVLSNPTTKTQYDNLLAAHNKMKADLFAQRMREEKAKKAASQQNPTKFSGYKQQDRKKTDDERWMEGMEAIYKLAKTLTDQMVKQEQERKKKN